MNILVIDDLRTMKPEFINGANITYARTSNEAQRVLEETGQDYFDTIYFDHDLGIMDGGEDTTYPIALMFEELAYNDEPYVAEMFVHTSNPRGAERLMSALREYRPRRIRADDVFFLEDWAKNTVLGTLDMHQEDGEIILFIKE